MRRLFYGCDGFLANSPAPFCQPRRLFTRVSASAISRRLRSTAVRRDSGRVARSSRRCLRAYRYRASRAGAWGSPGAGIKQSAGQPGRHSWQPVHACGSTACRKPTAPAMASTGHTGRQRPQPMHSPASMATTARAGGASANGPVVVAAGADPQSATSCRCVAAPPGVHRSSRAFPCTMARA